MRDRAVLENASGPDADAAPREPNPPEMRPQALKVLGLGFMKTGLMSFLVATRRMGLRVQGRRRALFMDFVRGDLDAVMANYDTADCFVDWPHPYMYRPFLKKYGEEARFVLTIRDPDAWYDSLVRHNKYAHPFTHTQKHIFGRYYPHGFPEEHKDIYNRHNDAVLQFFRENRCEDQLLVLETGARDGVRRVAEFVGAAADFDEYPRENVSKARPIRDFMDSFRGGYNRIAQPLYAQWAPRLAPRPGPYFTAVTADLRHHVVTSES